MTPSELAALVAAQRTATLARLQPVKIEACKAAKGLQDAARELKQTAKDNAEEREIISDHPYDLFPTPPELAADMVKRANVQNGQRVLEPSAGTGRIALAALSITPWVICKEINHNLVERLVSLGTYAEQCNFLDCDPAESVKVDAVIMNPPFSNGQDIEHVRHAYQFLNDTGTLVAIMSAGCFYRSDRKATAFREWLDEVGGYSEELPAGTFKQSGTNVNARLVIIHK